MPPKGINVEMGQKFKCRGGGVHSNSVNPPCYNLKWNRPQRPLKNVNKLYEANEAIDKIYIHLFFISFIILSQPPLLRPSVR